MPSQAGIGLANWTLRQAQEEGSAAVQLGKVWSELEPQQLPELAAPVGIQLQAAQEAVTQG